MKYLLKIIFAVISIFLFFVPSLAISSTQTFSEAHKSLCDKLVGKIFGSKKDPITKEECNKIVFLMVKDGERQFSSILSTIDKELINFVQKKYKIEDVSFKAKSSLQLICTTPKFYEKKINS